MALTFSVVEKTHPRKRHGGGDGELHHQRRHAGSVAGPVDCVGSDFLSSSSHDDDQRQRHDVPGGGFHGYDSAQRCEHGLFVQPGRVAQPVGSRAVRRVAFPVGRAGQDGQPAQPFIHCFVIVYSSTMRTREYTEADLEPLRRMHVRQGFDYAFSDLRDPIFVSKLVLEDDAGQVVMASLARLTCEMYLLMNREAGNTSSALNPQERYTHGCRRPYPSASAADS
jgi:hypothetical protein